MARAADFRRHAFDLGRVDSGGKDVGRNVYWKLYAIENILRVVIHSVLSVQINANWLNVAVDPTVLGRVAKFRGDYAATPWHSTPGTHDVYYLFLSDLNKIISANSHLFKPSIPDIDNWISRIEQINKPRNIVGHMNWLTTTDRKRIDVMYDDLQHLTNRLKTAGLSLVIPA